ncbi:MAG: SDR family NAD(P)-dependent oxidoreductase [Flavisolibacter sp.]
MEPNLSFENKTVVITGGSRGIGRACAEQFAARGANVVFSFHTHELEAQKTWQLLKAPGQHRFYKMNLADAASVHDFFQAVMRDYKTIDVLVNNAGVFPEHKIADVSFEEWQMAWQQTMQTNLVGVSNLSFLVARQMMQQKQGNIINISSRGAFRGEPDHPAYGASKAGLNSFSQSMAVALAPFNIRVTALAPGFVETDMAADYLQGEGGEARRQQIPLKRVATAAEVANAVLMLAAGGLDFMTGAIVDFNGASYLRT